MSSSPLRLLVITNLYPPQSIGGYGNLIADFCHLFEKQGHIIQVLTAEYPPLSALTNSEPYVNRHLKLYGELTRAGQRPYASEIAQAINQENLSTILQSVNDFRPDICLVGNLDLIGPWFLHTLNHIGIPTLHYVANANPGYPVELAPTSGLHRYVTCSNWVLDHMNKLGYPTQNAHAIYPGAAVKEFHQSNLPPWDGLQVAYASLVMPYKGADLFVEALGLLKASGLSVRATIAGDTFDRGYVSYIEQRLADLDLTSTVDLVGVLNRHDLKSLYRTHNVLAFPSRFSEPFGISQVEAMAAGLVVITSATGGAREVIAHKVDGLHFQSGSAFDLAEQLSWLDSQPEERITLAQTGQQKALKNFSYETATAYLESALKQLLIDTKLLAQC